MNKMKPFNKWMLVLIVISAAFPTNTRVYGMETESNVAYESLSLPIFGDGTRTRVPDPASSTGEFIQNKAFAHLEIISSVAFISAGFTHPDNLDEEVMIEWFLYGWKTGWTEPILLKGNVRATAIHHVEVNTQVSVPEFDYYLFQCKNKILNSEDVWIPFFKSESRFSEIAPMNGIWERTGEVTSNSAVLHTYLTEKPPFDATELENLRVPPMAGYARFVVYSDPDLQELVADSGYYPVDDYIQIAGQWQRTYYNYRWTVTNLEPDNDYYYHLETKSSDGLDTYLASNINSFRTSPEKYSNQPISFVVVHSLDVNNTVYEDPIESATRGLKVFDSMLTLVNHLPDFIIMQGDTVYYDGGAGYAPDVGSYLNSEFIRRWLYWCAQYQFENLMYFFQRIPGYWMVDDHDYWVNNINENKPDGWYIFRNSNPTPGSYGTTGENAVSYFNDNPYDTSQGDGSKYWRSIRWGQHLELFLEEGRNHRDEDANLIWGDEQREWLEQRIRASDATFKILVATTPLLGPVLPDDLSPEFTLDKHANQKFRAETELFLTNIQDVENVFIVAGDRHYKYHSVINNSNYPNLSRYNEFGSGSAAGPPHAIPGAEPNSDFANLLFPYRKNGAEASAGYLRVDIEPQQNGADIKFKLIQVTVDLDNNEIYQQSFFTFVPRYLFIPIILKGN